MKNKSTLYKYMPLPGVLAVLIFLFCAQVTTAQVASYSWAQSFGAYTPIVGGTVITQSSAVPFITNDDAIYTTTLPFAFTYSGVLYPSGSTIYISTNGFITFGATPPATTDYFCVNTATAYAGAIGVCSRDNFGTYTTTGTRAIGSPIITLIPAASQALNGVIDGSQITGTGIPAGTTVVSHTATTITMSANATANSANAVIIYGGQIKTENQGAGTNHTFVIQWKGFRSYLGGNGSFHNHQIRLAEANGVATSQTITLSYGAFNDPVAVVCQGGLRGATNADFNQRNTLTGAVNWSSTILGALNNAALALSSTCIPTSGLTWVWTPPVPTDLGATLLASPNLNNSCAGTYAVTVRVNNYGSSPITFSANPLTITWSVTGPNPSGPNTYTNNSATTVNPGTFVDLVVQAAYNMTVSGAYTFTASATCTGDMISTNNAMTAAVRNIYSQTTYPFTESFDPWPGVATPWLVAQVAGTGNWNIELLPLTNPTLAAHTGINMARFASYNFNDGTQSLLISPCMDWSTLTNPKLSFWMSHDNGYPLLTDNDQLMGVYVSTDGGVIFNLVATNPASPIRRYDATYTTPGWGAVTAALTAYAGQSSVKIGFLAYSGYGNNLAIDDINVINDLTCLGTPTPGTLSAPASACSGVNFSVSATGYSTGSSLSFQWQKDPGCLNTWSNTGAATSTYASLTTSQTANTCYRLFVTCTAGPASNWNGSGVGTAGAVVNVGMNTPINCYCTSNATSTVDDDIGQFVIGTCPAFSNPTGATPVTSPNASSVNLYTNFTGVTPAVLEKGSTYSVNITQIDDGGTWYITTLYVYCDLNQDGDFADAGELLTSIVGPAGPGAPASGPTHFGSVTIPNTASVGNTGLRLIMSENAFIPYNAGVQLGCGTYGYGETEDYIVTIASGSNCTGAPTAGGAATSSMASVCSFNSFSLNTTGCVSGGAGINYQWQVSTTNATSGFANISGATTIPYTVTGQLQNSWYRLVVTCVPSGNQTDVSTTAVPVTENTALNCYCVPTYTQGTSFDNDGLTEVALNTLPAWNQVSGMSAGPAYYTNFGLTTAVLDPGSTYNITTTSGVGFVFDQYSSVWIDYNLDGDLLDAGEWIGSFNSPQGVPTSFGFTVPITATSGITRMRVRGGDDYDFTSQSQACGASNSAWGETEDYNITINTLANCAAVAVSTVVSTANPTLTNSPFTLSLTGLSPSAGYTYQWESSAALAGPYTPISGATTMPYTFVTGQTSSTYYHCVVACSFTPFNTATSNPLLVNNNPYCPAAYTSGPGFGDYISRVRIEDTHGNNVLDNSSTGATSAPWLQNFAYTVAAPAIDANSFFWLRVNPGTWTNYITIEAWVDWNNDGDFSDASEAINWTNGPLLTNWGVTFNGGAAVTGSIYVESPAIGGAIQPGTKRLRLRYFDALNDGLYLSTAFPQDACSALYQYGETEDYSIDLVSNPCLSPSAAAPLISYAPTTTTTNDRITATFAAPPTTGGFKKFEYSSNATFTPVDGQFVEYGFTNSATPSFVDNVNASQVYVRAVIQNEGCAVSNSPTILVKTRCASSSAFWTTSQDYITNVTITGVLNNNSTFDNDGYQDFTSVPTTSVNRQQSYNISITCNGTGAVFSESRIVWLDYNGDNVFQSGEVIYSSPQTVGTQSGTKTGSFTIPCDNQFVGDVIMRVAICYDNPLGVTPYQFMNGDPCAALFYYYGEIEEYAITINPLPALTVNPSSLVCTSTTGVLVASGGANFQWSPANGTNGMTMNPPAGNAGTITVSAPNLTFFTVTGSLANTCTSSAVVPVSTVPIGGSVLPLASIVCSNGSKLLTATGAAGTYRWEYSNNGFTWDTIVGNSTTVYNTAGFTIGPLSATSNPAGKRYYRMMSKSACYWVASNTVTVEISQTPFNITFSNVTSTKFDVNWLPGGSGNYQITIPGAPGSPFLNCTSPKTITGLTPNSSYNVTIAPMIPPTTPACGGVNSALATQATMCAKPASGQPALTSATANTMTLSIPIGLWNLYQRVVTSGPNYTLVGACIGSATSVTSYTTAYANTPALAFYLQACNCPSISNQFAEPGAPVVYTFNTVPTCPIPTYTGITNPCPNQILISGLAGNGAGPYIVSMRRLSPNPSSVTSYTVNGTTFSYNVGGSPLNQFWEVYVRSRCGAGPSYSYSPPTQMYQVEVKGICGQVQNLVLSHPTCYGMTATWNAVLCGGSAPTSYQLFTKQLPSGNWNSYQTTGLVKTLSIWPTGSPIAAYVRANACNGAFGLNSDIDTITTACRLEEGDELQPEESMFQNGITTEDGTIGVYPNPNQGNFQLDLQISDMTTLEVRIEVMNMLGQTVLTQISNMSDGHFNDNVMLPEGTSSGNYIIRVYAGTTAVFNTKVNISK